LKKSHPGLFEPDVDLGGEGVAPRGTGELLKIVPEGPDSGDFEVMFSDDSAQGAHSGMFPSDELLLPAALNSYRKPVAAIHSVPERRDTSLHLSARKLMEALPLAVQLDLRSRNKGEAQELVRKIREDRASPLFEIRTKELARLAGISLSNMDRVHDYLAELVGLKFIWNVMHEDGQTEYEAIAPFLIRRDKGKSDGRKAGFTRFAFEPEILLWFLEPKMWANLSWAVMSGLGGKGNGPGQEAAFGLYQNIWRYIGTSAKLTPAFDVADWIDLVIGPSRFVQVDAKGEKRVVDYKDFKRRFLKPGLAILNAHPALNHTVEMKEDLSGKKVVRLRFKFVEKLQGSFDLPLGWPSAALKQLEDLGFAEKDVATMSQLYPYDQVAEALKRLPAAEQRIRTSGRPVYSRKAFFTGILGNVARGESQSAEEEAKLLLEAQKRQQKEDEAERMKSLKAKFALHQRGLISDALQELPEEVKVSLFKEHLTAESGARPLFKGTEPGAGYLVVFCKWLTSARPDLVAAWLPELKDQNFESWMAWRLTLVE
jgi:hypothetical protein